MDSLPLWLLVAIFVASAAVIWVAGILLSETTDVLDARLNLGSAFGGLIVLAVATNLPEVAITVSAAWRETWTSPSVTSWAESPSRRW